MWDKFHLISESGSSAVEYTASDLGVVAFTLPEQGATLKSIKIYGALDEYEGVADGGVGYTAEDGRTHLCVRIHGRNFMDGHELVRLMRACGSDAYGGVYDDEHFFYLSGAQNTPIASINHFAIAPKTHVFKMAVKLEEDIADGGKLIPGLYFSFNARSPIAASAPSVTIGETEVTLKTPYGYLCDGIIHKPSMAPYAIPIRYDSVGLYLGTVDYDDPYVGESLDIDIGTPLYCAYHSEACDELDCVSGILTRYIMAVDIDDSVSVSEVMYEGYPCFSLPLPVRAGADEAIMDEFGFAYDVSDFEYGDWMIFIGPDREHLYIYFMDEMSIDEVKDIIVGRRLLYVRETPEITKINTDVVTQLKGGQTYVEACSQRRPTVEVTYSVKE